MSAFKTIVSTAVVALALTACGKNKDSQPATEVANPSPEVIAQFSQETLDLAKELTAFDVASIHNLSDQELNALASKVDRLAELNSAIQTQASDVEAAQDKLLENQTLVETLRNLIGLERSHRQNEAEVKATEANGKKESKDSVFEILENKIEQLLKRFN